MPWGEVAANEYTDAAVAGIRLPFSQVAGLDVTGATDMTGALNAAFTAAQTKGGADSSIAVGLPSGVIRFDGVVTIPDTVGVIGGGGGVRTTSGTRLIAGSAGAQIVIAGNGGTISDLTIDGNNLATNPLLRAGSPAGSARTYLAVSVINAAGDCVVIQQAQNELWSGCNFSQAGGHALVADQGCGGTVFHRCEFSFAGLGALLIEETTGSGPYTVPTHLKFDHCIFERQQADVSAVTATAGDRVTFDTCVLVANNAGATAPIVAVSGQAHLVFRDGTFNDNGVTNAQTAIKLAGNAQVTVEGKQTMLTTGPHLDVPAGTRVRGACEWSLSTGAALVFGPNTVSDGSSTAYGTRLLPQQVIRQAVTDWIERVSLGADAGFRFQQLADGTLQWGDGTSFNPDVTLTRLSAGVLGILDANSHTLGQLGAAISVPSASLSNKTFAINVQAKYPGKMVWDSTDLRPLWAKGANATDPWIDGTGATVITPA